MNEQAVVDIIKSFYPDVQAIYRFGSKGGDYERPDSDVDLALLFPIDSLPLKQNCLQTPCHSALEDYFHRSVDLVNIRDVSTVFQNEILNTGKRLLSQNQSAVDEFEMLVLSFYQKLNEERKDILEDFFQTQKAYNV